MGFGLFEQQKVHGQPKRPSAPNQHGQLLKPQGPRLNHEKLSPVSHEAGPLPPRINLQLEHQGQHNSTIQSVKEVYAYRRSSHFPLQH